ncbi:hypothetical protein AB0M97_17490 [Streptomyces sp. NPDC051207]|uniref:hypothetical protein n=1 Tax=Streptomyces sp. NPDC051207 TaxID=3154641 RepID=UPI00343973A3
MSDQQQFEEQPEAQPRPVAPGEPTATAAEEVATAAGEPAAPAVPPAGEPRRRPRARTVTVALTAALAVLGGVGHTVVTVQGADRDAGAAVWTFPKRGDAGEAHDRKGEAGKGSGLVGMLVPYGTDDFVRGPDLGEHGSEADLEGERATALRKEALSGLPRTQRKRLEKDIDRQRISGIAMRSYLLPHTSRGSVTVSIQLARMENRSAARTIAENQSAFLDALDVLRDGPVIKGHKNAHCFLPPKDADEDLESMFCTAYVGNVLVTATTDAAKPFDTDNVASLLREQLDRIAEPGEAV